MHWIVQNNLFEEAGWNVLVATLGRLGVPFSVHKVVPFSGELVPPASPSSDNVICLGAYSMRHLAQRMNWQPGVFDLEPFDFRAQLAHWGDHLLNARSVVSTFGSATFFADELFVRPTTDAKSFAGRVFGRDEFTAWQHAVCRLGQDTGATLTADTEVQLAEPVTIDAEYRFWVVKGELVTASQYRRSGRLFTTTDVPHAVHRFVEARVAEWQPHEAFVIDVCESSRGLHIVEINTLNAAGFYAADLERLVITLERHFSR